MDLAEVDLLLGLLVPGRLDDAEEVAPCSSSFGRWWASDGVLDGELVGRRRRGPPSASSSRGRVLHPEPDEAHRRVVDALPGALEVERALVLALAVLVVGAVDDHGGPGGAMPRVPVQRPNAVPARSRLPDVTARRRRSSPRAPRATVKECPRADNGAVWTGRGAFVCSSERRGVALCRAPASSAAPRRPPRPHARRLPGLPAFTGAATARSAANQTAWNQDVSRAPVGRRSSALHRTDHRPGRKPGRPSRLRRQRRLRDPLHHRRPQPAPGQRQGHRLSGSERLRAGSDPRQRAGRGTAPTAMSSSSSVTAATCSRCTPPTTSAAHGHRWSAASTARFDLGSAGASPRRLDLGRRGGTADPSRAGPLRRGRRGAGAPRDPRHLLRDAARLHPPRHPLRLGPLRPQPAADGPAAAALERLLPSQPRPLPGGQPVAGDLQGPLPLRDHQRRQRRHGLELVHHRRPLEALEGRRPEPPQDACRARRSWSSSRRRRSRRPARPTAGERRRAPS